VTGYLLSKAAENDLTELWEYIAVDNKPSAEQYLETVLSKIEELAERPTIGRQRPEIAAGLRSYLVKKHVIFYRQTGNNIHIYRILHTARDLDDIAFSN
jgi:toxin ParE1/3/4